MTVGEGRILHVGAAAADAAIDLGSVAILPALVNAHTHLELSYLPGRVPPSDRFHEWIRTVMALRRQHPDPSDPEILRAARSAIDRARRSGTGLIGDISNTLVTVPLLRDAGMPARVFHELLGFREADAKGRVEAARSRVRELGPHPDVRVSLAPHAPYSVSPPLFEAIREDLDSQPRPVSSVHLGESLAEVEFVRHGTGAIRSILEDLGVWTDEWRDVLPAEMSPVGYLSGLGFLDSSVLAVHGVQFDGDDLTRLHALGVTIASCPRSNQHVGVGAPPLEVFYAMDVAVAFGTDSLASVSDLNVFAELAEARRLAPRVPARRLLRSATQVGAAALGFGDELGTIEAGKRAALIVVRVPERVTDVEEYLVSGIEPDAVTWLDESRPFAGANGDTRGSR